MVERTSMFGYSCMIPPQGVDRRGACHRECRKQGRNRSPIDRSHWSLPFWLACVGLFFLPRFCALKTSYPLHRYLACQFFPLHFWIRFMVYIR